MIQKEKETDKARYRSLFNTRMISLGVEIGALTLLIVLGAVFGGLWIDRLLGTKMVVTLILVLGSAPLAIAISLWMALRSVQNIDNPEKKKEEKIGE